MNELILIIGNKNYSSWSLRPWIFLKQNQIAFNEIRVPLFTDTTNEELSGYNSDFKVPILKDGDFVVWDSLSILEYISECYLESKGWPKGIKERAFARSVSSEMHSSFVNVRSELPMNCRKKSSHVKLSSQAETEIARVKALWQQCRSRFGNRGEWLFGEYSIADAMYAPMALRFDGYGIPLFGFEKEYVQSVLKQAGIVEWIEAGKDETEVIEEDEI